VATGVFAAFHTWAGKSGYLDRMVVGSLTGVGVAAMERRKGAVYKVHERPRPLALYSIHA
jgi:hypothetical protein